MRVHYIMNTLEFFNSLDPNMGPSLVEKPYWEISKSIVNDREILEIERGSDPLSFLLALERRLNFSGTTRLAFKVVQKTSCSSTITGFSYTESGKNVTRVNFNLRTKPPIKANRLLGK